MPEVEVVVLGAGVLGLTIAYQLSSDSKYNVRVIAKSLPIDASVDYTSQYAGANWRSVISNTDYQMIACEEATLKYFREFSKEHPELITRCMSYDIFDPRDPDANDQRIIRKVATAQEVPWFERICDKFHMMQEDSLPSGAIGGVAFDTVTINAPEYSKWLYHQCLKQGVAFDVRELKSLTELEVSDKFVMNCTGLGARTLFNDDKVYPIRGQTVLVKNTTNLVDTWSRVGRDHLSYLIPRPGDGGLIIGGCQQPNSSDYEVDHELAEKMLTWAKTLYPGVFPPDHEFEIIKHNVGLRPSRKGGVRIESEAVGERLYVHGYGIGGWGYQASWGIGLKMRALLEGALSFAEVPITTRGLSFDMHSAATKVKTAQNLWNNREPEKVLKAYTEDSIWRNRDSFLRGHAEIRAFLIEKWKREHNYRLRKELFAFQDNRIAVEFYYEYSTAESVTSQWMRCYGIEHWVFDNDGRMKSRQMSGNEVAISEADRWFRDHNVDAVQLPAGHISMK